MSMDFATLVLQLKTSLFNNKLNESSSKLERFASTGNRLIAGFAAVFTASKITGFAKEAMKLASDAQETYSKFDVVFEQVASQANKTADSLAQNYGMAGSTARKLLSDTGDLLTGFGFADKEALQLSDTVNKLAVDLASFSNYSGGIEGASRAITKAMLGETEMAKSLGVAIKSDTKEFQDLVKQKMADRDVTELQAKALVVLDTALKQTKKAQGDFGRTQYSTANLTRQSEEAWKGFKEALGKVLLEALNVNKTLMSTIDVIKNLTSAVNGNGSEWAYVFQEIKIYAMSGIKTIAAVLTPFWNSAASGVMNFWNLFKTAGENIKNVMFWLAENWDKIWDNMLDIAIAASKDMLVNFTLVPRIMIGNAVEWGKLFFKNFTQPWNAKENFSDFFDSAIQQATEKFANSGLKNLEKVREKAGMTELPELKIADLKSDWQILMELIKDLQKIPGAINDISVETDEKIKKLFEDKMAQVNAGTDANMQKAVQENKEGPKARVETTVADAVRQGSFEALKLENMTISKPDQKTLDYAKKTEEHTKKTSESLVKLLNKITESGTMTLVDAESQ
ncbi:MAG: hypothetical protein A2017_05545 [Lentisphaerae bacterium GWF2_44_16]|nr:MAG: hypothetical protein A2017_05545 [Lentisphaerae bacterium GWF2_44_16]